MDEATHPDEPGPWVGHVPDGADGADPSGAVEVPAAHEDDAGTVAEPAGEVSDADLEDLLADVPSEAGTSGDDAPGATSGDQLTEIDGAGLDSFDLDDLADLLERDEAALDDTADEVVNDGFATAGAVATADTIDATPADPGAVAGAMAEQHPPHDAAALDAEAPTVDGAATAWTPDWMDDTGQPDATQGEAAVDDPAPAQAVADDRGAADEAGTDALLAALGNEPTAPEQPNDVTDQEVSFAVEESDEAADADLSELPPPVQEPGGAVEEVDLGFFVARGSAKRGGGLLSRFTS